MSEMSGLRVALVLATSTGGVGRHVRMLAAGLLARGARVAVLSPPDTARRFDFAGLGARVAPVAIPAATRPAGDARAVLQLRGLLRRADIVHAHGLRAGFLVGLALRSLGHSWAPYVATWHNALPAGTGAISVGAAAQSATARLAGVVLGASPDLVERARRVGARDARFGPVAAPPLSPPERDGADIRAELGAGQRPVVLAAGRLEPQKDYPTLLDASCRLRDRQDMPLVAIAGEGPLRAEIAARVAEQGLPVRLLGPRGDVADLLRAADVVALPSRWEARSLVAQEALRAGRPLVATAVGGTPELVGDAAMLVPPGDPAALERAVARVLDEPGLAARMARDGQARAATFPTGDDTVDQIAAVYRELLAREQRA